VLPHYPTSKSIVQPVTKTPAINRNAGFSLLSALNG
jgi:hypothetical protein